MVYKQIFFSHTWRPDNQDRNNHERVYEIARKLRHYGWTTWVDQDDMKSNIDVDMVNGIDHADAVITCITESYLKKIHTSASNPHERDNCLKEWTYSNIRKKLLIPIIMEKSLLDISKWPNGIVTLYIGSTLYIDGSGDNIDDIVIQLNKRLMEYKLKPLNGMNREFLIKKNFLEKINEKLNGNPNNNLLGEKFRRTKPIPHRPAPNLIPSRALKRVMTSLSQ